MLDNKNTKKVTQILQRNWKKINILNFKKFKILLSMIANVCNSRIQEHENHKFKASQGYIARLRIINTIKIKNK